MKKNILTICLIAFTIIFSGALFSQTIEPGKSLSDLKAQVQAMNDKLAKANVAGDLKTVASVYADDIVYMPNYGPMIRGKEAMMAHEKKNLESGAKMTSMNLTTLEVTDMGDMVYEVGSYSLSMELPGMDKPWADKGKYVSIYRKLEDGSLEMVVDIWNTDVNPWEAEKE